MNGLHDLLVALVLVAWGGQAVAPWRLRRGEETARRLWGYAALPLFFAGALAALLYVHDRPDAALAAGLLPLLATLPGRLLLLFGAAVVLADGILTLGRGRVEALGWPLAAGLALLFLAAVALAGELLRVGEGQRGPLPFLFAAALCRLLVTLGAGEAVAPGRPLLAIGAGLALPLYGVFLPPLLARTLWASGYGYTLAAAALLFLAAPWLPRSLRRPATIAAALLAGLYLAQAADLAQALPEPPLPPMPALPAP